MTKSRKIRIEPETPRTDKGKIKELLTEIDQLRSRGYKLTAIYSNLKRQGLINGSESNFRYHYYQFKKAQKAISEESAVEGPILDETTKGLEKTESSIGKVEAPVEVPCEEESKQTSEEPTQEKHRQLPRVGEFNLEEQQRLASIVFNQKK